MGLTDIQVRQLPIPSKGQKTYWEKGFGVRVSQGGSKSFVVKVDGTLQTIGRYPAMSLKIARRRALEVKATYDPKTQLDSLTDALSAYYADCEGRVRPKTLEQYKLFLSKVKTTKLSEVKTTDIDTSSPHAVMAWKVFFNWCNRHELAEKNPFTYTPTKWKSRSRVLTDEELNLIWSYDFPPYSDYLKVSILTGQRIGQWKDFTIENDTLHFPPLSMKGGKMHQIPLTEWGRGVVEQLKPFNGWSKAKSRIDKTVQIPHWTVHDLRRTFSTIMASLQVPLHVTEAILAHSSGQVSGVAATYNRYNYLIEMREALTVYEQNLRKIVGDK